MKENFDTIIPWVFKDEGKLSNDKHDDGGITRLGIIAKDLATFRGISEKEARGKIASLEEAEVIQIYSKLYWGPLKCDDLPNGVDYFIFDSGLHSGIFAAAKWLQGALGVKADGKIGPITIAASHEVAPLTILGEVIERRRRHLKTRPDWRHFSLGWTNRVNKARDRALKMIGAK